MAILGFPPRRPTYETGLRQLGRAKESGLVAGHAEPEATKNLACPLSPALSLLVAVDNHAPTLRTVIAE